MKTLKQLVIILLISLTTNAQELQWIKTVGGVEHDVSRDIILDRSGNIYTAGEFNDIVDFDPSGAINELSSNGIKDIFIQKLDESGNFLWAISFGGVGDEYLGSITLDDTGNLYITGRFFDIVDFDPGPGSQIITSNGYNDSFIMKLDPLGNLIWVKTLKGPAFNVGRSITIDDSENIYITGSFGGTVDFDPNNGVFNVTSNGEGDVFILKLNSVGDFIWVKTLGGNLNDYVNSSAIDSSNNLYITGKFEGLVDFDPSNGIFNITANPDGGNRDIFILKLDVDGNFIWAKAYGNNEFWESVKDITIDYLGNTFVTGSFKGVLDFDPGTGVHNLTSTYNASIYLLKLNSDGNFVWAHTIDSNGLTDEGWSVTTDFLGNPIITGKFMETADFDPGVGVANLTSNGNKDIFIAKYESNGNFIWARSMGSAALDVGTSVSTDNLGHIFLTGTFREVADLDPGTGTTNSISNGDADIFVMKLIDNTLDIIDNELESNIRIYPNPTNGNFTVSLGQIYQKTETIIMNNLGQIVSNKTVINTGKIDLYIKGASGVYLVKIIIDGNKKLNLRVLKK
ncbi:MAG: T9SS type A sorting domain-containing protein [Flavobacteriaceae bacterium]|nr:T9SS type A sorting domain-containing protein [Flavobacteriaceae bacterium]